MKCCNRNEEHDNTITRKRASTYLASLRFEIAVKPGDIFNFQMFRNMFECQNGYNPAIFDIIVLLLMINIVICNLTHQKDRPSLRR